jgi:hypothetical protein
MSLNGSLSTSTIHPLFIINYYRLQKPFVVTGHHLLLSPEALLHHWLAFVVVFSSPSSSLATIFHGLKRPSAVIGTIVSICLLLSLTTIYHWHQPLFATIFGWPSLSPITHKGVIGHP